MAHLLNRAEAQKRAMSTVATFFRHCPYCGRRFEIRLEKKSLLSEERVTTAPTRTDDEARMSLISGTPPPVILEEERPATVDVDRFQYTYRCKHCGHEWAEVRREDHAERGTPED